MRIPGKKANIRENNARRFQCIDFFVKKFPNAHTHSHASSPFAAAATVFPGMAKLAIRLFTFKQIYEKSRHFMHFKLEKGPIRMVEQSLNALIMRKKKQYFAKQTDKPELWALAARVKRAY